MQNEKVHIVVFTGNAELTYDNCRNIEYDGSILKFISVRDSDGTEFRVSTDLRFLIARQSIKVENESPTVPAGSTSSK